MMIYLVSVWFADEMEGRPYAAFSNKVAADEMVATIQKNPDHFTSCIELHVHGSATSLVADYNATDGVGCDDPTCGCH
jgi:hypothetical protein